MTKRRQSLRSSRLLQTIIDGEPIRPSVTKNPKKTWVGIDGEGVTLGDPLPTNYKYTCVVTGSEHRYISMSYRDELGDGDETTHDSGLKTKDCLTFIMSIPNHHKIAAYGFGYDLCKILEDLPDFKIWYLLHPERRKYINKDGREGYHPVQWEGFALDWFNNRFKVGYAVEWFKTAKGTQRYKGRDWRTIHDLVRFYQAPFVDACEQWGIGTEDERETMRLMKKDRRNLVRYTQKEILDYSNKECEWLAQLAGKLDDACENIGVKLSTSYFGAGTIAKGLLKKWGVEVYPIPKQVDLAAMCAFFGGRFEISRRGEIRQLVHDWDISSAYPYQIFQLPCLKCGAWELTKDIDRARHADVALCRYSLAPWKGAIPPWGPFPFRVPSKNPQTGRTLKEAGAIPYPIESSGGWLHKSEFFAGQKLFPNVRFHEAWVYETDCDHKPYQKIPEVYLERMRIGKEGPGIVLKLGINAIAGVTMQTIGSRPFFNSVLAGMITAGTRAQLLEMLGQHERWSDVIMMATDGLWGLAEVTAPKPIETGTDVEVIEEKTGKKNRKPLGGWEHDIFENGVFMARPGVYFPLGMPDIDELSKKERSKVLKNVKARGIGVGTLYRHRHTILEHYEKWKGAKPYVIEDDDALRTIRDRVEPIGCERFVGLVSGILTKPNRDGSNQYARRKIMGRWTLQRRVISFHAAPKREEPTGVLFKDTDILPVRKMPPELVSGVYARMLDPEVELSDEEKKETPGWSDLDQPDYGES